MPTKPKRKPSAAPTKATGAASKGKKKAVEASSARLPGRASAAAVKPPQPATNPAWPYGARAAFMPALPAADEALASLTQERLLAVPIPDGAWMGPDQEARDAVTSALEALGRARAGEARGVAERIYASHHDPTVRAAAGQCRVAVATDDELSRVFGGPREALAARCPPYGLLLPFFGAGSAVDTIALWVEPLLGHGTFNRERAFADPHAGLFAPLKRTSLDRRLLDRIRAKDFPFPFFHHGMPEDSDAWGFVVRFERPLTHDEAEALRAAFDGATRPELAMGGAGPWFELAIADDSFGPGVPASDYRAFQKAVDLVLIDAHDRRELPIAWAAKVGFGDDAAQGDAWHEASAARARFAELAAARPELELVTTQQRAENEAPRRSLLDLMTSSADDIGVARVRALLDAGASANETDAMKRTPLLVAAELRPPSLELLRCLLDAGAGVNARDLRGRTALHEAAHGDWEGNAAAVRLLLDVGARPEVADVHGKTPLHRACASGDLAVVQALVAAGAPLAARDWKGTTPLDAAGTFDTPQCVAVRAWLGALAG